MKGGKFSTTTTQPCPGLLLQQRPDPHLPAAQEAEEIEVDGPRSHTFKMLWPRPTLQRCSTSSLHQGYIVIAAVLLDVFIELVSHSQTVRA